MCFFQKRFSFESRKHCENSRGTWVVILEVITHFNINHLRANIHSVERKLGNKNLHSTKICQNQWKTWNKGDQQTTTTKQKWKNICLQKQQVGEPCVAAGDSPVSSVRPLDRRKELEWLPACLYFLNLPKLGCKNQEISTSKPRSPPRSEMSHFLVA